MSCTQSEIRSIAEQYPFLPHTIFHAKNHRCLQLALENIDAQHFALVCRHAGTAARHPTKQSVKQCNFASSRGCNPTRTQRQ
jgi:hypothetical protein